MRHSECFAGDAVEKIALDGFARGKGERVDQAVEAYPDQLEKAVAVTLPYSVGIGVPKNKPEFRDAVMAALVAIQKAGIQAQLLNKWSLGAENLEKPKLIVAN